MQKILILGSGGREHALALKVSESPDCEKLFIAPGNAGTANCGQNVKLDILDFQEIKTFSQKENIDLIIVGPEAPLVEGIYDAFKGSNTHVFGPSKLASQLEGSKAFANEFMHEFNIPTAGYLSITPANIEEGFAFIDRQPSKIVLKADGLAAGKGVLILDDKEQAKKELELMLSGKFGSASSTVVLEEFLDGIEFSVFVVTDGKDYKVLPEAKDYKRIGEGDVGLNTGGMGAISPVPFVDKEMWDKVEQKIIKPTIEGLKARNYEYKGFIFLGLIKVGNEPFVIEYNCRMGDPETEVVIPRLNSDLLELISSCFDSSLSSKHIEVKSETAATVMLVSGGYPEQYEKGKNIVIGDILGSQIYHAGTIMKEGKVNTNGGRVMAITSFGIDHKEAVQKSLDNIQKIQFDKMNYRKDIGFDL